MYILNSYITKSSENIDYFLEPVNVIIMLMIIVINNKLEWREGWERYRLVDFKIIQE